MLQLTGKVWLISDTHFGHDNIVDYCGRPINFSEIILKKLRRIDPKDSLIHCGDVAFIRNPVRSQAQEVCEQLPGARKYLVFGNHDRDYIKRSQYWNGGIFGTFRFEYKGLIFSCRHHPYKWADNATKLLRWIVRKFLGQRVYQFLNLPIADICVHGHIHNLGRRFLWTGKQLIVNACVEHWDYAPIDLDLLVNEYELRRGRRPDRTSK